MSDPTANRLDDRDSIQADPPVADPDEEAAQDEMGLPLELQMLAPLSSAFSRLVGLAAEVRAPDRRPRREASYVVDRRGEKVPVQFDKITARNEGLRSDPAYGPELASIDSPAITADVVRRFRNGMTTRQIDAETADICIQLATHHTDYESLAARVLVSDLHKRSPSSMGEMVEAIKRAAPSDAYMRLSDELLGIVHRAEPVLRARLDFTRDYRFRYFGFKTLARSYLIRSTCKKADVEEEDPLTERPQHMYMRIALGLFVCRPDRQGHLAPEPEFARNLALAMQLYDALSLQLVSNASPTILNAATRNPQLSSCFQNATGDDLPALFYTLTTAALCSKWSGGVSTWLHNVRSEGAPIRKTGGRSQGLGPYLRIHNDVQLYVDQGGNRPGAFAMYLSVDHADIFTFLAAGRKKGDEGISRFRAPDMKYALWVPDLFMRALLAQLEAERVAAAGGAPDPSAGDWYLFCPDEDAAPGLHLVHGEEYERLYWRYVQEGKYKRRVKAGDIVAEAFKNWAQEGTPFVLFKDHINAKSNMANVAPICSSNICCEILISSWSAYDAPTFARFHPDNANGGEVGVCVLAAVCLESYVCGAQRLSSSEEAQLVPRAPERQLAPPPSRTFVGFDFAGLIAAAGLETQALNRVIDLGYHPTPECRRSCQRHRPIGIGLMGLADVYARLGIAYASPQALALARAIAACIYYGALKASAQLAETDGPYASFEGSPISRGLLQPDLWVRAGDLEPGWEEEVEAASGGALRPADWRELREAAKRGVRNVYVTAYMPTATTSNIVGQNECFEPFTSNVYTRKTLAGEFLLINRHLQNDLIQAGLWDDRLRRDLLASGGSIQGVAGIPEEIKRRYRTAREIHPSLFIRTVKAMAPFVCQSASLNLFLDAPDLPKILRFLVEGWKAGLKCGLYYLHTRPSAGTQKTALRMASPSEGQSQFLGAPKPRAQPAPREESVVCDLRSGVCSSCVL